MIFKASRNSSIVYALYPAYIDPCDCFCLLELSMVIWNENLPTETLWLAFLVIFLKKEKCPPRTCLKLHLPIYLHKHLFIISSWHVGYLTHSGRVTHISISKLIIIGSDNGLSPGWCQAIIWTNAGILSIGPLRTNFSEISIEIHIFSLKKMYLKMSLGNWQPSCPGLNVLKALWEDTNSRPVKGSW